MAAFPPEVFGDFLLVQRLARSAMAEVLLAVRLGDRSGRTFVVKRPLPGERASGRAAQAIAREAEVLEAVRGPGLPALEAAGEIAGLPYVAVEHVRGAPLDELLARASPLSRGAVSAVASDLARALATLHAAGWVHGDVTPSNVIVDDAGEARLLDLGLARRVGERRVDVAGKPGYVAPEAVLPSPASAAEDVYGFGVMMAECALGRRLYEERDLVEAATRGGAPKELAAWEEALPGLGAALARRPEARPGIEALRKALEEAPVDRGALAELANRWAEAPLDASVSASASAAASAPASASAPAAAAAAAAAPAPAAAAASAAAPAPAPAPALALSAPPATALALSAPPATALAPPAPAPAPTATSRWVALALAGVLVFLAGGLVGRVSARARQPTFSYAGALPRRAQLELDGKLIAYPIGGGVPVEPGTHTLAIVLSKGPRREYTFNVRPGEHIVLTPLVRRGGQDAKDDPPEDGAP